MEIGFHTNEYSIYFVNLCYKLQNAIECHKDRVVTPYLEWLGVHVYMCFSCEHVKIGKGAWFWVAF
jgi:hypothetical protein